MPGGVFNDLGRVALFNQDSNRAGFNTKLHPFRVGTSFRL